MRVWLMVTTMAVAAAVIAACGGDDATPQAPTPTLSEDEAWAIVVDKVLAACPKGGPVIAQKPHRAYYTDGRWHFSIGDNQQTRFTVYEETRTVTGDSWGLSILAGSNRGCR